MINPQQAESEFDVSRYIDAVLRRIWIVLAVWLGIFAATVAVIVWTKPVYQAATLILIEKERGSVGATYSNGLMVENTNADYYETQYRLLRSESMLKKVYDQLDLKSTPQFGGPGGLGELAGAIQVAPIPRSRLVYIKADSTSPELAARIANGLAKAFVDQNLTNQLFISKDVLQILEHGEDSPQARRLYEGLAPVVNNLLIQNLKGEFAKLQSQAADLSSRYTPKHPAVQAIRSNMAAVESQIRAETDKVVQSLKAELSGQLKGNNVRVVDLAATPGAPIRPRRMMLLMAGLIGGLVAGIVLAVLLETLDQTIRSESDIESRLALPFLGSIPQGPIDLARPYAHMLSSENSLTSESIRNLRTMVDFAGIGGKSKALLMTSSVMSEGKSFIASNLAVAFTQMGESVLLIDGDLRRPKLHKNFAVSSEHGLSEYLASAKHVDDVEGLLQQTDVKGLSLLPCGPRPPNPSELLNTPRVAALVAWANERFDRVIVDCTPMFPISDTLLWGRHIRSAVFVTRHGQTRIPLAKNATQRLSGSGMKILGVVVNGVQSGGLRYTPYAYYQQYYAEETHKAAQKA